MLEREKNILIEFCSDTKFLPYIYPVTLAQAYWLKLVMLLKSYYQLVFLPSINFSLTHISMQYGMAETSNLWKRWFIIMIMNIYDWKKIYIHNYLWNKLFNWKIRVMNYYWSPPHVLFSCLPLYTSDKLPFSWPCIIFCYCTVMYPFAKLSSSLADWLRWALLLPDPATTPYSRSSMKVYLASQFQPILTMVDS